MIPIRPTARAASLRLLSLPVLAVLALASTTGAAAGQTAGEDAGGSPSPAVQASGPGFEASAGFYVPNAFGRDATDLGWMVAGRFALPIRGRVAAFGHYSIAAADEIGQIGSHPDFRVIGLQEHTLTAGVDYAMYAGFKAELAAGAVARRNVTTEVHGNAPDMPGGSPDSSWSGAAILVPGLAWHVDDVVLRLRNMVILDDVTGAAANVSLTLGILF